MCTNFQKNPTTDFLPLKGAISPYLNPKKPPWVPSQDFPGVNLKWIMKILISNNFLESFVKIQGTNLPQSAKKCHFCPYLAILGVFYPLLPPWGATRVFPKNPFGYFQIHIMTNLCAKFWKNPRYGFREICGRTNERTNGRTRVNY